MKKITLILLAVLLITAAILLPVYAADPGGVTAGEAAGPAGGTVDVYVSVYGLTEVTSIALEYAVPEGLTYKSAEWLLEGDMKSVDTAKKTAVWGISSANPKNLIESTQVFKITYQVAENAVGEIPVDLRATVKVVSETEKQIYNTTARINVLIPAASVTLSQSALTLDLSGATEENLTAQILPENTTDKLTWTSSDPSVVTVDRSGKVTAVGQGTAQITAAAGNVSAVCNVTVTCSHTGAAEMKANEATCEADGNNQYFQCSACRQYLKADKATVTTPEAEKLTKLERNAVHHPKVASTCDAKGSPEYWSCDRCSKNFANSECTRVLMNLELPLDPYNHSKAVEWTKTAEKHSAAYTCCGVVEVPEETHVWSDGKCSVCQYECAHSGGKATCTAKAVCEVCQAAYGNVDAANHTGTAEWTKTAEKHSAAYTCCGAVTVAEETHAWSDSKCTECQYVCQHSFQWKVDKEATEEEAGLKHEECVCGAKRSENTEIPKLGHTHKDITHHAAAAATCTKAGTVEYWTCSSDLCKGKYYSDDKCQLELASIEEKINPENHAGGTEVKDAVAANCCKPGYTGDTYCKGCGAKIKTGSALNATGKHVAAGAWLSDATHHYHACATDGCTAKVDVAAHSFQWKTDKEATEQEAGLKHEECGCGYKRNENTQIDKLAHEPVLVPGKENTCTEDGVMDYFYCANCDKYFASDAGKPGAQIEIADTVLKATGHSYGKEWKTDGSSHWHVCHCGDVSDKAAHTEKLEGAVQATKDQPGYTGDKICSVCGYEISKGEVIPSKQEEILDDVQNAQSGSSVQIAVPNDDGTADAVVPSEVLEAAKGKDVVLVLDMDGYQWTIVGSTITGTDLKDINLKVELDTQKIPAETIAKLTGVAAKQLSLAHEGEFGFKANLKVNVGAEHAGKNAKLYYYNADKTLEPVGGNVVGTDGSVVLEFSHASDYVIVVEEEAEEKSGAIWWILLAVAAAGAAAAAAVIITRKKRSK